MSYPLSNTLPKAPIARLRPYSNKSTLNTTNEPSSLIDLIETLQAIDENSPIAKLNQTTISDNNGKRIHL